MVKIINVWPQDNLHEKEWVLSASNNCVHRTASCANVARTVSELKGMSIMYVTAGSNVKTLCFRPQRVFVSFPLNLSLTATASLCSINRPAFVMEALSFLCEIRNKSSYIPNVLVNFNLQRIKVLYCNKQLVKANAGSSDDKQLRNWLSTSLTL